MKQLLTMLFAAMFAVASLNAVAADEKQGTTAEMKKETKSAKTKKTTKAKKSTKKKAKTEQPKPEQTK